ncbi:MAG: glycosyltransferase [Planctomycetaceae bacterium]|nr:glycosyltransferase [Planctomycetaceae bacterium]
MDQSGAERQLWLLASQLPDHFDPEVVALSRGGYFADRLTECGVPVTVLEKRFRFDPLTWYRLRRHLHRRQPDVIQSFLFAANAYVRLPGVAPRSARVVISERCVDSWKSGWQLAMDRRLRSKMNRMTANSQAVADFYRQQVGLSAADIDVIPNGVPAPANDRVGDQVNLRQELGLPPDSRLVGFVGRLAVQKRLKDLIWAFHLLQSALENVYLVVMGEGDQRQPLADLARDMGCRERIFFTGHSPHAGRLIPQLDVFCLPSEFEGMSNSLMEALSSGVPVAVSDIAANRELVQSEETGLVFPLGNGPEMARALKRLLEDDDLVQKLTQNAQTLIRDQHSVRQMVNRHVDLYQQL